MCIWKTSNLGEGGGYLYHALRELRGLATNSLPLNGSKIYECGFDIYKVHRS